MILNKIKCLSFFILLLLFVQNDAKTQIAAYSNEFLNIGIDAASLASGNAVVAGTNGVCSGYWNPSGLVLSQNQFETSLMHANYFSGLAQYDYLGLAYKPSDSLALGISIIRFGVDDIPNTLDLIDDQGNVNYDRISYFSVADYAFLFSVARKTKIENLNIGANLKLIYRRQGEFASAYGFGFDLGAQYQLNKWKFGLLLRDASSTFNLWIFNQSSFEEIYLATGNEIPENSLEISLPKLITGTAYHFRLSEKINLLTEINFDWFFDGKTNSVISGGFFSINPHIGLQISYLKNIHLRAGLDKFQKVQDFDSNEKTSFQASMGIGFYAYGFSLDYALTDVGDMSIAPVSHIFSLKYVFGKTTNKF